MAEARKPKRSVGRPKGPSKLTPELQQRLTQSLEAGNYRETSCRYAGLGTSTFYRWMEYGQADKDADLDTPLRDFWEAVTRAEANAEVRAVGLMAKAMGDDWRAAAQFLERKYPDRWGRRERLEHVGAGGGPIRTENTPDLSRLSPAELRELRGLIERAASVDG